jgi:sugar phosphate permease
LEKHASNNFADQVAAVLKRRWPIWLTMSICFLIVYFHRVAPAVVADRLMADFAISGAALGNLSAIYLYVYGAMQIPAGILNDSIGPRRTAIAGMVVAAIGSLAFAAATSLWFLYLGRFLTGLGVAVIFISVLTIQGSWFRPREFATMTGLNSVLGNLGAIMAATPLAFMVIAFGWRMSFQFTALLTVLVLAGVIVLVKNTPQELGLPSINEIVAWEEGRALEQEPQQVGERIGVWEGIKIILRNKYTWPGFFGFAGIYGTIMAFSGIWGVPYLMQIYDMTRTEAANYMMIFAVGNIVGQPLVGFISDRMGSRKLPYVISAAVLLLVWLVMTFWNGGKPPVGMLAPLMFVLALAGSGFILTWACAKEVNPPSVAGTAMGTVNSAGFIGGAILQPLFGWALDLRWQGAILDGAKVYPLEAYQLGFLLCVGFCVMALIASLLLKETGGRNIYAEIIKPKAAGQGRW